ncbi:hypothetical protein G6N82_10385 [Altererythrobacter sp. BO-6]|uniref:hypothetical protein n=1 Tax=Altererythrobacter sp. BO-6 TaxID=2604537 RepID=UPI0013E2053F|nr:hypothetical protein [Altererythrobacter sp. BO-6]QIG54503.1 hypothetical protein G6N82_10385 [Altererythrobacter sp. BO-6]
MNDVPDEKYDSGWKKVATVGGKMAAVGVLLIAVAAAFNAVKSDDRDKFGEGNVLAEISAGPGNCTPNFPLEITLTNVASQDVLNVGFIIEVSDEGHSTVYYSQVIGSDRIIPFDHVYQDCFAMPQFYIGETNPIPADAVPYNLASPRYDIIVSGTRLRGEE